MQLLDASCSFWYLNGVKILFRLEVGGWEDEMKNKTKLPPKLELGLKLRMSLVITPPGQYAQT